MSEISLLMEGLNCANCAGKIEKNVNKIKGVSEASINLMSQEMLIEYTGIPKESLVEEVTKITVALEPHVVVSEKIKTKTKAKDDESGRIFVVMEGLNCPNCAGKIEKNVGKLKGVAEVSMNLMNEEMIVDYQNVNKEELMKQITDIILKLEPDVKVYEKTAKAAKKSMPNQDCSHEEACICDHEHSHTETGADTDPTVKTIGLDSRLKKRLVRYAFAIFFYAIALTGVLGEPSKLVFFIGAYALFGADVLIKAARNIARGEIFDENFLMGIATIGAFAIGDYAEAVAVMLFYQAGEFLQDMAVDKSRKSIKSLMNLKADYANLADENTGAIVQVDPAEVSVNDIILVKPGEKVPLDGIVIEGETQIDASSLLGESVPRSAREGDTVMSGTVNLTGAVKLRVIKDYENSTVAKIMDMVENASNKKAPTERFITKFSKIYTPIVVALAAMIAILPPLLIQDAIFSDWLYRGLVFLVVSCPCALVISVPLSFFSGIGQASRKGVLVKGSAYLQSLNEVDTVVFDKTGTLTKGVFTVTEVETAQGYTEEELMKYAASVESFSNHPIAKSIVKEYKEKYTEKEFTVSGYEEISGKGVRAFIGENQVYAGNIKLMADRGIEFRPYEGAGSVVYVAKDNVYMGYIVISDIVKEDSKKTIEKLKARGIKTIMLTGDRKETADIISSSLGIDEVYSELLPDEKVYALERIYENNPGVKVAYAGDGINDAPVLARADVGIAMGGVGSDAAIEAADVVIMTDEPSKIPEAILTANKTMAIARQNIVFALGVKILVLILSAIGFASLWLAIFADVGVALLAVLNSMRNK